MWKRQWVTVRFIVDNFKFQGRTWANVNVDDNGELLEPYLDDYAYLEDVEFVEPLIDDYNEEDIPKEDELTDENLGKIVEVYL